MGNVKAITRKTYFDLVLEEGKDVFMYTYTTAIEDDTQRLVAQKVNDLAMKFEKMNIKSVLICSYDVNMEHYPQRVDS